MIDIDHRIPLAVVTVLALPVLVSATALADTSPMAGTLTTTEASVLAGQVDIAADGGLHVDPLDEEGAVALTAAEATVETEWERGRIVESPTGSPYRQVEESGRSTENLSDVRLAVGSWTEGGELLVAPRSPARLDAQTLGKVDTETLSAERTIARGGYSDQTYGAGADVPSYHYRTAIPLVAAGPVDQANVTGTLEVFANNATLEAEHEEGSWSSWTGFRTYDTPGPTAEYELRVIVVHLEEASASLRPAEGLTVLSRDPGVSVDGSVEVPDARGQLSAADRTLDLAGERAHLSGEGDLDLRARSQGSSPGGATLELEVAGEFELLSANLAPASAETADGATLSTAFAAGLATAGVLAAAGWWQLSRGSMPLTWLPAGIRERLHDRWKRRVSRLEDDGRRIEAARAYRTMTRLRPQQPLGWYGGAINELEAGRPARALALLQRAREELAEVPLDLLELQVAAASRDDRVGAAREALVELAGASPRMANALLDELKLEELRGDPVVAEALDGLGGGGPTR